MQQVHEATSPQRELPGRDARADAHQSEHLRGPRTDAPQPSAPSPAWPLAVLVLGLPVWWLLGVWQFLFPIMAIPMAVMLAKQRKLKMPRGFGTWLLWLVWLFFGVLVLQIDAPGTVEGSSVTRYLTFAYRYSWYVAATIVALYVLNTRHVLKSEKIVRLIAWMFVMFVAGGVLGLLVPHLHIPSLVQVVLPHSISQLGFVQDLTMVRSAQLHEFLGAPQPRPSAPFAYTNNWGFATAITMPFFVVAWWGRGRRWKVAMWVVLTVALVVIVASLNRGMWVTILAALGLAVMLLARRGDFRYLMAVGALALAGGAVIMLTSLGDLIAGRLVQGHSDEGRGNLAGMAIDAVAQGSPLLGFGTTRNLAGTFSSIAGGATEACPSCEPPPIGTHGQLWEIAFGAGFVGLALYLLFFVGQFVRNVRVSSPTGVAALLVIFMMLVALPFYSAQGVPLYIAMIAVGLLARERLRPSVSLRATLSPVLKNVPLIIVCAALGAGVGLMHSVTQGVPVAATQRVLVPAAELVPVAGVRQSSLDMEAALVRSDRVIAALAEATGMSVPEAQRSLRIGAEPNTRVLRITVDAVPRARAKQGIDAVVAEFLRERDALLQVVNVDLRERSLERQAKLTEVYRDARAFAVNAQSDHLWLTIADLSKGFAASADVLMRVENGDVARSISGVTTVTSRSVPTLRVANGVAVGALVGVGIAFVLNRRLLRVGEGVVRGGSLPLPIVSRCAEGHLAEAVRTVEAYAPLSGVIADSRRERASRVAAQLDLALGQRGRAGSRALIVIDPASRIGEVWRLVARLEAAGVEPVGLILCKNRLGNRELARSAGRSRGATA